jgi:hypothetical protein
VKVTSELHYQVGAEMFVETVSAPREQWQIWTERLRLFTDPPPALVGSIGWLADGSTIINVNVWDSAAAVADFYLDRVEPIIEAYGQPAHKPVRHGEPVVVYVRPTHCQPQG